MPLTRFFSSAPPSPRPFSLWSLLWALCALALLGVTVGAVIFERAQTTLRSVFAERGSALIASLEGSVRTGSRLPGGLRFQYLLEELSGLPEVRFIAVAMPDGTILAHGNPARTGEILSTQGGRETTPDEIVALAPGRESRWTIMEMEGGPAFVVYRVFQARSRRAAGSGNPAAAGNGGAVEPYVFLGLDAAPLEKARRIDLRRALFAGFAVFGGGAAAALGVYGLRRLRLFRRGQRVAEALAEELAVTLPDGLMLLDPKMRVARMNDVALRMLGFATAPQGRRAAAVLPRPLGELVERLHREATLPDTEIRLRREGRPLYLEVRGGHVEDGREGRLGSLVILRDLSEVRRLEAEIRRREQLAAIGNLAAGVAHEIRNPLSSIKGYATYFSGRFPEGSEDREAARVMVGEVERLNRAVTELIGLSRATDVRLQPVDLGAPIRDTLRLIAQDAALRKVEVSFTETTPLTVSADPDRLRQVILNLCLNALEAMPSGGRLDLELHREDDECGGMRAVLEVRDTGSGIRPEDLPRIFDPYFTTKGGGTGLGLSTAHKIMEAHGGSVSAVSDPGSGATFRLCLPLPGSGDAPDPEKLLNRRSET